MLVAAGQRQSKSQVIGRRRIGQQHQPGHPRLDHDRLPVIDLDHHTFATATDARDGARFSRRSNVAIAGENVIGRRSHGGISADSMR